MTTVRLPSHCMSMSYGLFKKALYLNHYDYLNYEYWHAEYKAYLIGDSVSDDTITITSALEETL